MEKLSFQVTDPELLDFIYSLGRERSKIICHLLKECMEEGDGYVPPRIMAATGFSYKNKKHIKKSGVISVAAPRKPKKPTPLNKEETRSRKDVEEKSIALVEPEFAPVPPKTVVEQAVQTEPAVTTVQEPDANDGYVSSAPKANASLVMRGLAAFGGGA
jgi:hypothetical protein